MHFMKFWVMKKVNAKKFKKWLLGQRMAEMVIERERFELLNNLTPKEALSIYTELASTLPKRMDTTQPSYLLITMRKVLARYVKNEFSS